MQAFKKEIKITLAFGLLSAIAGAMHFPIPGFVGAYSDARELVALSSVFFLADWRSALLVGALSALGPPFDQSTLMTLTMHIVAIPLAWKVFQYIKQRFYSLPSILLFWALTVIGLYFLVYTPIFLVTSIAVGSVSLINISEAYCRFSYNLVYEVFFTTIITTLILQIQYLRRDRNLATERMKILLSTKEHGLWEWNIQKDHITLNKSWVKSFGYDSLSDGITGKSRLIHLIHEEEQKPVERELDKLVRGQESFFRIECRVRNANQKYKWIFVTGKVVERDHLGRPNFVMGTLVDIDSYKRTEQENKALQARLIQSQKMESIGTLAGGIAHDFNNLLTVINGHSEIALMDLKETGKTKKHLHEILEAGKRASRLTRQLLAFSRKQVYQAQPLKINNIINELGTFFKRIIGEDIDIRMVLSDPLPTISADPSQLEQILMNLVVNARDAINEKTDSAAEKKITIETQNILLDASYKQKHPFSTEGNFVLLSVSDNGKGMDTQTKEKIFEPFFTTKPQGKGTGLGMATVYGIVKQNNGHIIVYSEPGEGTTIKIYWPVVKTASVPAQDEIKELKNLNGTERILLVEDDRSVRKFAHEALTKHGYLVKEAKNGIDALSILKDDMEWPQLLITDLIMPQMNGQELAKEFSQEVPQCKILFASGYPDNHIVHNGALEKDVHFIHKPYSVLELLQKVRFILDDAV